MYSSCIFCYSHLGTNEVIESYSIGSRVAFDPAKGRLWVVCPRCGRWNLSPLEDRWESVEAAERAYRTSSVRAATENISIAKASDGAHLIRIGKASRHEVASWRYGDRFSRRWRKSLAYLAVFAGTSVAVATTGTMAALLAVPGGGLLIHGPTLISVMHRRRRVVARLEQPDGSFAIVRGTHADNATLLRHSVDGWAIGLQHAGGKEQFSGREAIRVAGPILAHLNSVGARRKTVNTALQQLQECPSPDHVFQQIARKSSGRMREDRDMTPLAVQPRADLLALEMAAHVEIEREALEGELRHLERAWREAEMIASISDNLLLPRRVVERLARIRQDRI